MTRSAEDDVSQDPSCLRGFLWNIDHGVEAPLVIERLQAGGWAGTSVRDLLWTFVKGTQKVVFVPASGRMQVRVDMMTPYEVRRQTAVDVWKLVTSAE